MAEKESDEGEGVGEEVRHRRGSVILNGVDTACYIVVLKTKWTIFEFRRMLPSSLSSSVLETNTGLRIRRVGGGNFSKSEDRILASIGAR